MKLHQLNLGFDPQQDRLLLRISTTEQTEYRLWLTRRIVKAIWPGLVQLVHSSPLARQQSEPAAKQAVVEFQREKALSETRFSETYDGERYAPALPGEPLLVWGVRMRPVEGGGCDLEFLPKEGQGVKVRLQDQMLHALNKLFQDALKATDWDIALVMPSEPAPAAEPVAGGERKLN